MEPSNTYIYIYSKLFNARIACVFQRVKLPHHIVHVLRFNACVPFEVCVVHKLLLYMYLIFDELTI